MTTMVEITKRSRARAAEALTMRRAGKLLREIGARFGVGVDRARSMVETGRRIEARKSK